VRLDWKDIVALNVREHHVLSLVGHVPRALPAGTIYSVYSLQQKLNFTGGLPGTARLASIISQGTGLSWQ
jgi:hypothetical protein